jgi:hypothetical protein
MMTTRTQHGIDITGGRAAATFAAAGFICNGINIFVDITATTALKLFTNIQTEYCYNSPQAIIASLLFSTASGYVIGSVVGSTIECVDNLFFKPKKHSEQEDPEFTALNQHGM